MRIIASDYDGTLNNHGGVTDEKRAAIRKWREAGNLFGLVSGRSSGALPEILAENPFDYDFFIGYNGGIIINSEGEFLYKQKGDGRLVRQILKKFFELGAYKAHVHAEESYFVLPEKSEEYPEAYLIEDLPDFEFFYQLTTIFPVKEQTQAGVIKLKELFGDYINPLQNSRIIDAPPAGVDKAQGIYKLMKILNITYDDVITVGNDINDYAMIAEFNSYAVENAAEEILKTAKHTTYDIVSLIETEMAK